MVILGFAKIKAFMPGKNERLTFIVPDSIDIHRRTDDQWRPDAVSAGENTFFARR